MLLDQFVPWLPSSYQTNLRRLKKASSIAFADRHLLRDSTTSLFKANIAKEERKKTRKRNDARNSAFGRVLTQAMVEKQRLEEEQKALEIQTKKEAIEARKANAVVKRKEADDARAARMEKKRMADDAKAELQAEKIKKKAERMAMKIRNMEEKRLNMLEGKTTGKKRGRPSKQAPIGIETQQSLPEFVPESAYPDPGALVMEDPYFVHEGFEEMQYN